MQVLTSESARRLANKANKDFRPKFEEQDYDISEDAQTALEHIFVDVSKHAGEFSDGIYLDEMFSQLSQFTKHEVITVLKSLGYKVEELDSSSNSRVKFYWT